MLKRFTQPQSIILDNIEFKIKYTVRKNMRRMLLRLPAKNTIHISLPKVLFPNIKAFILENRSWLISQNKLYKEPFARGEQFYFQAKAYTIEHHTQGLRIKDERVYLNPLHAKKHSDDFYKKEAKAYLPNRLAYFEKCMGLHSVSLRFYCAKRRWGSCNAKGVITLNPYLMKLSLEMIDYVLVHELAHLKHLNHSKAFYALVKEYMPHYKEVQNSIESLSLKF